MPGLSPSEPDASHSGKHEDRKQYHPPAHQEGSIKAPVSIRTSFAQGFRGGSALRKKPATNSIAAVTTNQGSQKLNDPGMKKQIGMTVI
jgi:hypothetical protein